MKPIERVYAAGIVITLITCGVLYLDLRAEQRSRDYFEKEMKVAIRSNWEHRCPTNQTPK
jgi:uncharacterized membrane protein YciS (DUF1049 family)